MVCALTCYIRLRYNGTQHTYGIWALSSLNMQASASQRAGRLLTGKVPLVSPEFSMIFDDSVSSMWRWRSKRLTSYIKISLHFSCLNYFFEYPLYLTWDWLARANVQTVMAFSDFEGCHINRRKTIGRCYVNRMDSSHVSIIVYLAKEFYSLKIRFNTSFVYFESPRRNKQFPDINS